ncbi:MAG: hypothetical protein AB7P04_00900 [Bacteriovoracia bacterium]
MKPKNRLFQVLALMLSVTQATLGVTAHAETVKTAADAPSKTLTQRDKQRKVLVQVRNQMSGMNEAQWTKTFTQAAEQAEKAGQTKKARFFNKISNPKYQPMVIEHIDGIVANDSTNVAALVLTTIGIAALLVPTTEDIDHMYPRRAAVFVVSFTAALICLAFSLTGEEAELI